MKTFSISFEATYPTIRGGGVENRVLIFFFNSFDWTILGFSHIFSKANQFHHYQNLYVINSDEFSILKKSDLLEGLSEGLSSHCSRKSLRSRSAMRTWHTSLCQVAFYILKENCLKFSLVKLAFDVSPTRNYLFLFFFRLFFNRQLKVLLYQ